MRRPRGAGLDWQLRNAATIDEPLGYLRTEAAEPTGHEVRCIGPELRRIGGTETEVDTVSLAVVDLPNLLGRLRRIDIIVAEVDVSICVVPTK